tara:strand:- start:447 stop:677 length:231 start_codon:yes stop_codon:yes gene_type:complete
VLLIEVKRSAIRKGEKIVSKIGDLLIEAQEYIIGYMDDAGYMQVTETELYQLATQQHGVFFADCVKQVYKEVQEDW